MGVGNVTSVRCSSQSDPNNAATPRTPNIANTTKPLNIRRASRLFFTGALIGTSAAHDAAKQQGKILYAVKFFLVKSTVLAGQHWARTFGEWAKEWRVTAPPARSLQRRLRHRHFDVTACQKLARLSGVLVR